MELRGRNKVSPNFNMSSMTDIVFLLLIFFMLTSTLVTSNALDLVLPTAKGKTSSSQVLSVNIDKNLNYFIDKTPVDPNLLEGKLKKLLGAQEKPSIMIRAEKSVPIEDVVKVLDIARRNKYKAILATKPK
ncbi:MAG: biopolymer transporter ExbD [Ichthyobacteriaceae bacterium]|nr:biopolymer transporter ExbD [Ichthyobacteriaceae bacterium]